MDFKIRIEHVLGLTDVDFTVPGGGVVEVVGPNAAGKTSLATCIQALIARKPNPLSLSVADARKAYLHDGDPDGSASLDHDGDLIVWRPGNQTVASRTDEPLTIPEAAGLVDFTARRSAKERAALLQDVLLPPPDQVMRAVEEQLREYLPPDDLRGALAMLLDRGWEPTEAVFAERARDGKRQWRAIAGRNYGSRVAADWRPDGWQADYDSMTVSQAESAVTDARDAVNALHQVQAISAAEAEDAEAAKVRLPELRERVAAAVLVQRARFTALESVPLSATRDREATASRALAAARAAAVADVAGCPHCGGMLAIVNGAIVEYSDDAHTESTRVAEEEHAEAARALMAVQATAADMEQSVENTGQLLQVARTDLGVAERTAERTGVVDDPDRQAAIAEAEQAVEDARAVVKIIEAHADAGALHQTVARYESITRAIGPQGVRARMLSEGLSQVDMGLDVLAGVTGWPRVRIADDGSMTLADRPLPLCSESERWRAQVCIQLTLAAITGAKMLVLDRADLLDGANRESLVKGIARVVERTGLTVLLCSTGEPADAPPWPQLRIADGVLGGA